MSQLSDPFGTEALRASVLRAWRDSPTRFTEDTNAETDLRVGGYRDRLFVELAQNAADAAALAGAPGTLRVSVAGRELRVANTGAPLDAAGVASLASLRASAKQGDTVGQFGVGFAAVLAVSSEPRVISRTGGVAFSETRTREAAGRDGTVPVLRLPWPADEDLPAGFDTEVRLPLREGVDADELLARLHDEAEDLLLSLPWLARIEAPGAEWTRSEVDGVVELSTPSGTVRWLTRVGENVVWAKPVDGRLTEDVLHAPTPTDERLSLPARLIATVPLEPSRRRVLPGADDALAAAAREYPALVRELAPEDRLELVPEAGFPLSEVDGKLRELVGRQLATQAWLPAAEGGDLVPSSARVLSVESPRLLELLAGVVPGLAGISGYEPAQLLATVDADRLDVADLVDLLIGVDRDPEWWRSLYDAFLPLLDNHEVTADELGALPVPLADGRTLPGPRGALLLGASELLDLLADADVGGLRLVHPEAAHPLLERLGAKQAEAADLLDAPALREAIERSVADAESGLDTRPLAEAVLRLVSDTSAEGLGALALPSAGGWRRADELVLPNSPLCEVFDPEVFEEDGPFSVLDAEFAEQWPSRVLTELGVLDEFLVVDNSDEQPEIRDLDLVADDAWPQALRLIAGQRETWQALTMPDSPSAAWLERNALLAGRAPAEWRLPDAASLTGLYDPVPDVGVRPDVLAAAGVRAELAVRNLDDAADLLDRLGDPDRDIPPGLILRAHALLAAADLEWAELDAPERVRTVDGSVVDAERTAVLDLPWLGAVWAPERLVAASPGADVAALAELLDIPLLSEHADARVSSDGEFVPWAEMTALVLAAELLDSPLPEGGLVVHDELTVEVDGVKRATPWWVESGTFHGEHHAEDSPEGLARAFAWAAGRWSERHLVEAVLNDPATTTYLL
ncbi:sacsin N-terminal ATP-binding-like domain-containing protein [Amycolatopsis thermoflava]|uniref:sacsin N-terminal ATP-binding-like domain-containing protein n=1 Tax=Amycolatopsis thermoflava TaxID=84480 RepID=UPI003EB8AF54